MYERMRSLLQVDTAAFVINFAALKSKSIIFASKARGALIHLITLFLYALIVMLI